MKLVNAPCMLLVILGAAPKLASAGDVTMPVENGPTVHVKPFSKTATPNSSASSTSGSTASPSSTTSSAGSSSTSTEGGRTSGGGGRRVRETQISLQEQERERKAARYQYYKQQVIKKGGRAMSAGDYHAAANIYLSALSKSPSDRDFYRLATNAGNRSSIDRDEKTKSYAAHSQADLKPPKSNVHVSPSPGANDHDDLLRCTGGTIGTGGGCLSAELPSGQSWPKTKRNPLSPFPKGVPAQYFPPADSKAMPASGALQQLENAPIVGTNRLFGERKGGLSDAEVKGGTTVVQPPPPSRPAEPAESPALREALNKDAEYQRFQKEAAEGAKALEQAQARAQQIKQQYDSESRPTEKGELGVKLANARQSVISTQSVVNSANANAEIEKRKKETETGAPIMKKPHADPPPPPGQ